MSIEPVPRGHGRWIRPWVALVWALAVGLATIAVLGSRDAGPIQPIAAILILIVVLSQATTGAVLGARLPRHPIGWLLLGSAVCFAVGEAAATGADRGLAVAPGSVPGSAWLAWLSQWVDGPAFIMSALFVPLLFPTGSMPSRRWRPVAVAGLVLIALVVLADALGDWTFGATSAANPLFLGSGLARAADVLAGLVNVAAVPLLVLVIVSLVGRYRRAEGVERLQLRWFAYAGAIAALGLLVGIALGGFPTGILAVLASVGWAIGLAGIAGLPIAVGIAVLRYRLFEIDVIIRRTAVYLPLTAILAGVYAATISLLQRVFVAATGSPSDGAVILSTLVLATTFTPIKGAIQGVVDRRFGASADGDARLHALVTRLAAAESAPDLLRTFRSFLRIAADAYGADWGAAYRGAQGHEAPIATVGAVGDRPMAVVDVGSGGHHLGRIELGPRTRGRPYSPHDMAVLRSAAVAIAAELVGSSDRPTWLGRARVPAPPRAGAAAEDAPTDVPEAQTP